MEALVMYFNGMRRRTKHHDPFDIKDTLTISSLLLQVFAVITINRRRNREGSRDEALEPFRIKNQFRKQHIGDLSCVVDELPI